MEEGRPNPERFLTIPEQLALRRALSAAADIQSDPRDAEIAALRAQVARLALALAMIAAPTGHPTGNLAVEYRQIAQAALEEPKS